MTIDARLVDDAHDPRVGPALRPVLAEAGIGTWWWDAPTGRVDWDGTLEALHGMAPGSFGSTFDDWVHSVHPDDRAEVLATVQDALEARAAYHVEHRVDLGDGSVRWVECRGQVLTDEHGAVAGTVGCAIDITDRKTTALEQADTLTELRRLTDVQRRRREQLEFLARLTHVALRSDDHVELMGRIAAEAVPDLGDWCSIHFLPDGLVEPEIVVAHSDPARVAWAEDLVRRYPYDPDEASGVARVIRTGETEYVPYMDRAAVERALATATIDRDEALEILDELGLTSYVIVPLRSQGSIVGALQLVSAESGRRYDAEDVALAEAAAARVGEALAGLWTADRHRHIASTLQDALLPPVLPAVPGIDLTGCYWPAGVASEVGGDCYDVFRIDTGWAVLIGDVCGSGPDAAAMTSIVRHTVRAAARHGHGHDEVLSWVNEAVRLSDRDLFCTACYATLEPGPRGWVLRSAVAGHPLPVRWRAGSGVEHLGEHGTLLGVYETIRTTTTETLLEVGDVVVVHTDGITDLPPPHGLDDEGLLALVDEAATSAPGVAGIAGHIRASVDRRLAEDVRPDDIALVLIKVDAPPDGA